MLLLKDRTEEPEEEKNRGRTQTRARAPHASLRLALNTVRCIARMRVGARAWARHDQTRRRLAECYEGMQREERIRAMRDQWRAEVAARSKTTAGLLLSSGRDDRRGAAGRQQQFRGRNEDGGGEVGC